MQEISFNQVKDLAVNGVAYWSMVYDLDKQNAQVVKCEHDDKVCVIHYQIWSSFHRTWLDREERLAIG